MGIISDLLEELDMYTIATEAEDITGDVKKESGDVSGGGDDDSADGGVNDGEIDLNTDDLLAPKNDKNDSSENEDDASIDDNTEENSENGDENLENEDGGLEDGDADNSDGLDGEETNDEDSFSKSRKKKIRNQFLYLNKMITDTIDLIGMYAPNVSDNNTTIALSSIKNNMTQSKEIIFKILTEEFKELEYHELLKKYIALTNIYDLSVKSLDTYFKKYNADKSKNKKDKKND